MPAQTHAVLACETSLASTSTSLKLLHFAYLFETNTGEQETSPTAHFFGITLPFLNLKGRVGRLNLLQYTIYALSSLSPSSPSPAQEGKCLISYPYWSQPPRACSRGHPASTSLQPPLNFGYRLYSAAKVELSCSQAHKNQAAKQPKSSLSKGTSNRLHGRHRCKDTEHEHASKRQLSACMPTHSSSTSSSLLSSHKQVGCTSLYCLVSFSVGSKLPTLQATRCVGGNCKDGLTAGGLNFVQILCPCFLARHVVPCCAQNKACRLRL